MATLTSPAGAGEALRPLTEFAGRVPGRGGRGSVHLSTISRWCSKGVPAPGGRMVKLRAIRFGSSWATSEAWWTEFLNELQGVTTGRGDGNQ